MLFLPSHMLFVPLCSASLRSAPLLSSPLLLAPWWAYGLAWLYGAYLLIGLAFALWFAALGNRRVLPSLKGSSLWLRLLMLPGSVLLWPLLLIRAIKAPAAIGTRANSFPLQRQRGRAKRTWMLLAVVVPVLFVAAVSAFGERPQQNNLAETLGQSRSLPAHAQTVVQWRTGGLFRLDSTYLLRLELGPVSSPDPRLLVDGAEIMSIGARGSYEAIVMERPFQWSVYDALLDDTLYSRKLPMP